MSCRLSLNVALRAVSGDRPWGWNLHTAEYVGPDGTQQQAAMAFGPQDLRSNARATGLISFENAELGGRLFLSGAVGEADAEGGSLVPDSFWDLEIPIGSDR